ncbi:DUF1285 domain-containing protein [Sphingomonas donggukensis]|uniref:DUF1285 domain-containing protein n=1 Tax=Sphingomonas donggukensis TaxID=2949093 RepID=A0ABY4U0G0_9SPHN|nr:DUF1285 domain-containing protein [Sphingomonas donggukensis]URW76864.1 DUF1285 domain-containing protein [Sphingomonas donggukensis]
MPMPPPPDIAALSMDEIAALIAAATPAPVEQWHPSHCGDSEMRIARDGTWFHQGSPIGRQAMVRKFATILRREADGGYVLVNPAEKLDIAVEDAPFVATAMKAEGGRIAFQTNLGDLVIAGPDHPLRFESGEDGPRPYIHIRGGLEALVSRAVYYELANLAIAGDASPPGVSSDGMFFALEPA